MKIIIKKQKLEDNPEIFLRKSGYAMLPENSDGVVSFARRLGRDFYPRFHIYIDLKYDKEGQEYIVFNIHLDQKKPGYEGQKRHNAEYDGNLVEREVSRLKSMF